MRASLNPIPTTVNSYAAQLTLRGDAGCYHDLDSVQ